MIRLSGATVLVQWAAGGLLFLWVTTRRREVGLGYGWLLRGTYALFAVAAIVVGAVFDPVPVREVFTGLMTAATVGSLVVSVQRRRAGVAGQREVEERRSSRVASMTGIDRDEQRFDESAAEFPPLLDLAAPVLGAVALVAAGIDAGDPALLAVARTLVGAAFLGVISDAMLLGHWYLVQPGLSRRPLQEMIVWTAVLWPAELVVMLWPTGMIAALHGTVDDGYNGLLSWFWAACAITTIVLVGVTRLALRERAYSAVMAATGLLYLAILTGFGMDLVARAILA